jgi:hypothetical protein
MATAQLSQATGKTAGKPTSKTTNKTTGKKSKSHASTAPSRAESGSAIAPLETIPPSKKLRRPTSTVVDIPPAQESYHRERLSDWEDAS